ncbi:MAG: alpha-1,4-glucan--maltose-1-phosphate maltosyltransferase [Alphaproteobacteria bacterium]|nr:alpha-1,4-glucan--maltose-1-phosphate maltosyltransferase [Alphaproteobacteria bacterium]
MGRERKIKPKATPVLTGSDVKDVSKRGWIIKEKHNHLMDYSASSPITIENVYPQIDEGRYAVKREVGDVMDVSANIFKDGHDLLKAVVLCRYEDSDEWWETPMYETNHGLAQWEGQLWFGSNKRYIYTIEAWVDEYGTWLDGTGKKIDAGQDVSLELIEGADMVRKSLARLKGMKDSRDEDQRVADIALFEEALGYFDKSNDMMDKAGLLFHQEVIDAMDRWPDREKATRYDRELEVYVDRERARFAAWYEMNVRCQSPIPGQHGTFKDAEARLPDIQSMGFDVVYLLPIHPIGYAHRKGKNNSLVCGPDDVGSPYAIGNSDGGHRAINPLLGTMDDFRSFVNKTRELGMEVAMDFAIQCSPDHPWIKEHPEWFTFRPDGTIKYAENPPKKYQDIVNVNFYGEHSEALWYELKDTFLFWANEGVRIFRIDNPHTKSVPFWEWVIREVQNVYPDTLFLAEAFTRPPMMQMLAKIGFSQSYSYFAWRETKHEIEEYFKELTLSHEKEYFRPNLFPTTPDIMPFYLHDAPRSAFIIRYILAATLSPAYGMLNGYELCENDGIYGKEEFNNSEKYEIRTRDWNQEGNIKDLIATVNWIRGENPALQGYENLRFYTSENDNILFYGKMNYDHSNMIFVAVSLDPYDGQAGRVWFPTEEMNVAFGGRFHVEELLSGREFDVRGNELWVNLYPAGNQAEIYRVTPIDRAW